VGAFGPRPDLVLSGVNHGINVGRSALHSGTVGAALTAAHFRLRALAASIRWGEEPVPWTTASTLAAALVPGLAQSPEGTVLNLNVPNIALSDVRGARRGRLSRGGSIRSAVHDTGGLHQGAEPPRPHLSLPPAGTGTLRLDLAPPGEPRSDDDLETDAGLVAAHYASLTALVGVREATGPADDVVTEGLQALTPLLGRGPEGEPTGARPGGSVSRGG
jgi:broad specificity polyphosphatase/5'/3'-nucleotidase SurE